MADTVRVKGLRDLNRAFQRSEKALKTDLRESLRRAAEPVREDAEVLAASEVTNIDPGDDWSEMRTGVTQRLVYVAPRRRATRGRANESKRRPNLAGLLSERALEPALERNQAGVVREVDEMLGRLESDWGRG